MPTPYPNRTPGPSCKRCGGKKVITKKRGGTTATTTCPKCRGTGKQPPKGE